MPKAKFDSHAAQLHLEILITKGRRIKGLMNSCELRKDQEGVDKQSIEFEAKGLEQQFAALEKEVGEYENKILSLTEL